MCFLIVCLLIHICICIYTYVFTLFSAIRIALLLNANGRSENLFPFFFFWSLVRHSYRVVNTHGSSRERCLQIIDSVHTLV